MDLLIHMFIFIFYRNSFYMFILMILSLSYPYMPYVSLNYVLCWSIVLLYMAGPHVKQPLADESSWLNMF